MTQLVTCRSGNLSKTLLSFHHPIAAVYIYKYSSLYFCRFVTNAEKKKNRHLMGWQPFEHILPLCVLFRSLDSATCEVNIILHFIMKVFIFFFSFQSLVCGLLISASAPITFRNDLREEIKKMCFSVSCDPQITPFTDNHFGLLDGKRQTFPVISQS